MVLMIINYNKWFYDQHKYLTGSRNNVEGYVDTKWVDINKRYRNLIDAHSSLMRNQPFMVYGNKYGFDELIDLMGKSNYTFADLDEALSDTYRMSLQNAMSRNVVNTHAVIFHCNNMTEGNATSVSFTHYRIIDVPFDQMHFGPRDEFIRQKLHEMHTKAGGKYVDIFSFNTSPIGKILDFSIVCSVNGRISNDCYVAIDDKGFKFKVGWPWAYDVEFIIYKLDHSYGFNITTTKFNIENCLVPYDQLPGIKPGDVKGLKCLLNIYDPRFLKTIPTVPNFGIFDDKGLNIVGLQKETLDMLTKQCTTEVNIFIHVLKYFHEVPNMYPAVNYYDILDQRLVYDEKYERIMTADGERVVSSSTINTNYLTTCTPPIVLDRDVTYSFTVLMHCVKMYDELMIYNSLVKETGKLLIIDDVNKFYYEYIPKLKDMTTNLEYLYNRYQNGAILTSIIPNDCLVLFRKMIDNFKKLCTSERKSDSIQNNSFDELYDNNYKYTVEKITAPFINNKSTDVFLDMGNASANFYNEPNNNRFNRPVSEQSFIALKYDHDMGSWVFACPDIRHFSGIGNSFYINTGLNGNELFKFFVLYTDTEAPATKEVPTFTQDIVFDYDKFVEEMRSYIGCIRYWDAENKLLKMSRVLYNRYSDETCTYVLSKILKRKIDGQSILSQYPSEMNYEESNGTSDNWKDYTETSERAPFSINFMFYTLMLLNDNEDRLQAYFYGKLTEQKFNDRYNDIDIRTILDTSKGYPINYSRYSIAPTALSDTYVLPDTDVAIFYTLPFIVNGSGNPYPYTFNVYDDGITLPAITANGLSEEAYVTYETSPATAVSYTETIRAGKLISEYLCNVYDYISKIQTNYKTTYNCSSVIESANTSINKILNKLTDIRDKIIDDDVRNIVDNILHGGDNGGNPFLEYLDTLSVHINSLEDVYYYGKYTSFIRFINMNVLGTLKQIYLNYGFKLNGMERIRQLYIHLKKINTPMNPYQFMKWFNDIDVVTMTHLKEYMSEEGNEVYKGNDPFASINAAMLDYKNGTHRSTENTFVHEIECINGIVLDLTGSFYTLHVKPIQSILDTIVKTMVFDMYALTDIAYSSNVEYNTRPVYAVITLANSDKHVIPPIGTAPESDVYLVFQAITDEVNEKYIVTSFANICEYVFFDGDALGGVTMTLYDENGTSIEDIQTILEFKKVSSTAEEVNTFNILPNVLTTTVEFENGHESFEVTDDLIVNEKHADMNYELLSGNRFLPLDHEIEYVLEPVTWLQGSIDRIHIENQWMNRLLTESYSHDSSVRMFFKPSQVIHLTPDQNESLESVYGKYFEGQTVYLKTMIPVEDSDPVEYIEDGHAIFPVKITAIDHEINKGFIEAEVDSWNAEWFELTDPDEITRYLTNDIVCEVVDDNIRNFLDEFSDGTKGVYFNPGPPQYPVYDEKIPDCYSLPGDPIYVSNNADYVYTRLKWMFSELVPNRFIDEEHKTHRFIYLTNGFILNADDELKINMINRDFNTMTLPQEYPVLRDEPNDHVVWAEEIRVFTNAINEAQYRIGTLERFRKTLEEMIINAHTESEREEYIFELENVNTKLNTMNGNVERWKRYLRQMESPSTWFNVVSYDAALVYIDNGRADKFSPAVVHDVRDAIYTDDVDILIYDWEHKHWLDPSLYTIEKEIVDNIRFDEYDDFNSKTVLCSITIKPALGVDITSSSLLVYMSYNKSDVFDSIDMNSKLCTVKFKPYLTMDKPITDYEAYSDIAIRKHFDGYEKYLVDSGDITITRVKRNGKFIYAPSFRVCDLKFEEYNSGSLVNTYDFNDIDKFYVKSDFQGLVSNQPFCNQIFTATINAPIDGFAVGDNIKLIAISNDQSSSYDGNISSVMFEGFTSGSLLNPSITITKSTLPAYVTGKYICTVFQDDKYDDVGGVVTIRVSRTPSMIYDDWVEIPRAYMKYREIPNEFKVTLTPSITGDKVAVILEDKYIKDIDDEIYEDNSSLNNPFEYYYSDKANVRLPISDTRCNAHNRRLYVDTGLNTDVKLIKSPYIGICRYSLAHIPEDGLIDMTGYLPTPLSRNRYEFWVNGRYINNTDKLVILSPTSIQLRNLTSLKNFEVIELVDDVYRNDVMREGNLYTDINGNTYATYRLALLANTKIRKQDVKFVFNANVHDKINDYTKNIIEMPNNHDTEADILDTVTFDNSNVDYNRLMNLPSINGVTIFHPKLQDLGINEIPNEKIIEKFDEVWRLEAVTNPVFMMTHRGGSSTGDVSKIKLHVKMIDDEHWNDVSIDTSNMMLIYTTGPVDKYFSLYISNLEDGVIDDVDNTVKIIPFITPGVYILIDKSYKGLWLHSTDSEVKPIHLV